MAVSRAVVLNGLAMEVPSGPTCYAVWGLRLWPPPTPLAPSGAWLCSESWSLLRHHSGEDRPSGREGTEASRRDLVAPWRGLCQPPQPPPARPSARRVIHSSPGPAGRASM